ncbi:MAG: hypothetical protein ACOX4C_02320 [Bacillota bacterium]
MADTAQAAHAYAEAGVYWPTLWVADTEGEVVGAELCVSRARSRGASSS